IARALVRVPRVILADEPTGALDVDTGSEVMDLLDTIARENGSALIAITHDLAVASRAARQFRLADGVLTPIAISARSAGSLASLDAPGAQPGAQDAAGPYGPGALGAAAPALEAGDDQAEHVARPLVASHGASPRTGDAA
ncbi:MAG: hypothetical protein ACTHNI_18960, partial [Cellulosimicrobium cellulans]